MTAIKRGKIPNIDFYIRKRGDKLACGSEKPHVQRMESKFGTDGLETRKFDRKFESSTAAHGLVE